MSGQADQDRHDTMGEGVKALNLAANGLIAMGLPHLAATSKPETFGKRLAVSPKMAIGMMAHFALIGLCADPFAYVAMGALLWFGVIRHRIWPSPWHSFSIGDSVLPLPRDAGRAMVAAVSGFAGLYLLQDPWMEGPALSLLLGAAGSIATLVFVNERQAAEDQDAVDARHVIEAQTERLRERFDNP